MSPLRNPPSKFQHNSNTWAAIASPFPETTSRRFTKKKIIKIIKSVKQDKMKDRLWCYTKMAVFCNIWKLWESFLQIMFPHEKIETTASCWDFQQMSWKVLQIIFPNYNLLNQIQNYLFWTSKNKVCIFIFIFVFQETN